MKFKEVCSAEDIVALTEELGFLPFFANSKKGQIVYGAFP